MNTQNNRPKIICHMMTSLDGKIHGAFMGTSVTKKVDQEYERTNNTYHPDAWLCGRVTTEENFTDFRKPDLLENAPQVPAGDFIAVPNAPMYYVSVDRLGKVGWTSNTLHYMQRPEAHIIEVLSEQASNAYRDLLRRLNISYIIAGKEYIDCTLASQKLKSLFGINTLMVSGGGYINGSFLAEGLIDELSLVMTPATDASSETSTLFETGEYLPKINPVEFKLLNVEKLNAGGLWLRYEAIKNTK